ncbi:hypothetical protein MUN82_14095 [Hymenobacter aerilatus]|uniref:Uncharacterized protein n=1 Tax=Hymenobacter aerilatus TaxID=2932251 RepID=A0A8T9STN3_9BACT|nr:hypothetical protein [Hymenobacter aerilatus]UOR04073.1 hypothetical protein MUN82_14095 [Hymenobacter aerilatus]
MKRLLFILAAFGIASAAQAQLLPTPHQQNPDWTLQKVEAQNSAGIAAAPPPATDAMPNAMQKSIASAGNHRRVWDAQRQLAYEWMSRPDEMAPDKLVLVREQRTGAVYTYARKAK